jgi:hypothetical protein
MRLSDSYPYPDNLTPLRDESLAWQYFNLFSVASGYFDSVSHYTTNSLTEEYMKYGSSPLAFAGRQLPTNLSKIAGSDLTERLGRLMNSFWIPSLDPIHIVGDTPSAADISDNGSPFGFSGVETTAQVMTLEDIYVCHDAWLGILLISALVLLLSAFVGLCLKFMTKGPEIFGHISSFTRDNPYVNVLPGGSTLNGFERAKLLKDVKIRLGDVRSGINNVGHIAVMTVDGQGSVNDQSRLNQGRFYD